MTIQKRSSGSYVPSKICIALVEILRLEFEAVKSPILWHGYSLTPGCRTPRPACGPSFQHYLSESHADLRSNSTLRVTNLESSSQRSKKD